MSERTTPKSHLAIVIVATAALAGAPLSADGLSKILIEACTNDNWKNGDVDDLATELELSEVSRQSLISYFNWQFPPGPVRIIRGWNFEGIGDEQLHGYLAYNMHELNGFWSIDCRARVIPADSETVNEMLDALDSIFDSGKLIEQEIVEEKAIVVYDINEKIATYEYFKKPRGEPNFVTLNVLWFQN